MRSCVDCRWHHTRPDRLNGGSLHHFCMHPMNRSNVDSAAKSAYHARSNEGACGPAGHLHSANLPRGYSEREC